MPEQSTNPSSKTLFLQWAQMNCLSILVLWGICGLLILFSSPSQNLIVRTAYGAAAIAVVTVVMYMVREPWRNRDKRQHARVSATAVRIKLTSDHFQNAQVASRDLSSGGLGITITNLDHARAERLAISHAVVSLTIDLPGDEKLDLSSIVAWALPGTGESPTRMGLQFVDVDEDSREQLRGLVKWLAQGTGDAQNFSPDDGV